MAAQIDVNYQRGVKPDRATWSSIEHGQQTDQIRRINTSLIACITAAPDEMPDTFRTMGDVLYAQLSKHVRMPFKHVLPKEKKMSKKDLIKLGASSKRLKLVGDELCIAIDRKTLMRFLHHDIYEVRGVVLMIMMINVSSHHDANELDVVMQKFLSVQQGQSYVDPTKLSTASPLFLIDANRCLDLMRAKYPFDGISLAISRPAIIWRTQYDQCLASSPIRPRNNQRETIHKLQEYAANGDPFLLINRSPPGAGKSALLVPIAKILLQKSGENLYVCAGQGWHGAVQFMQALYSASLSFAAVTVDNCELTIKKQYLNKCSTCRIFVGTTDAISMLLKPRDTKGWVIIDEPTYGADIANSTACTEIMRMVSKLTPELRKVIMFSATMPSLESIPSIVGKFGRQYEVLGNTDSIQIACVVTSPNGTHVMPHHGCTMREQIVNVREQVMRKPFIARMYTMSGIVSMCSALKDPPDIRATFNVAVNLRPDIVMNTALSVLDHMLTLSDEDITAACAHQDVLTTTSPGVMKLVVDANPIEYALSAFMPTIELMREHGLKTTDVMYRDYERESSSNSKLALAAEARKKKSAADEDAPKHEDSATAYIDFPDWAQLNTYAYTRKFNPSAPQCPLRVGVIVSNIPQCGVSEDLQLLLMMGVGVMTTQVPMCKLYQSEVWRRASLGELAYVITDHTGCYGANMIVGAAEITESFAAIASLATIEQAGGRLCRVGLTYHGDLTLPDSVIDRLLHMVRTNSADVTREAINMEACYNSAETEA